MKTKLLSLFCVLVLLISAVPAASALEGESQRAADTLVTLQLLPSQLPDLNATASRAQAALLLVRLAGAEQAALTASPVSLFKDAPAITYPSVCYAARQGWFNGVATAKFDPNGAVTANAWFAALLRMLGYRDSAGDFTVAEAALFAQHIGLSPRLYSGALTYGQLYETAVDALSFSYREGGDTILSRLMSAKAVPSAAVNALGLAQPAITVRQAADRYLSAVFCLATYKTEKEIKNDDPASFASGFFITPDGIAVTNYHAIDRKIHAVATLSTDESYPVESVLWYDADMDLAVIKVSQESLDKKVTSAFSCLELLGTRDLRHGDTVYTLGNPLGLGLAVSSGIVSATARESAHYALPCVMNTADISQGSSGGALLNVYGRVIAVTTGAFTYGNNMYLAVPVDPLLEMTFEGDGLTLTEVRDIERAKDE